MKNEVVELRVALRDAVDRDASREMCALIEEMLDPGTLRYFSGVKCGRRTGFWSTDGSMRMLDRILSMDSFRESCLLELFLEQELVLRTNRRGTPGLYFSLSPTESADTVKV